MARLQSARAALAILTSLNLLNYVDRYLQSGMLSKIAGDLHLNDSESGLLSTVLILTYASVSPLAGWLGDRRARLPIAAVGVLVWSVGTFGSGLAPTLAVYLVMRALVGVGEASYAVVTPPVLSDYYPPRERPRALSMFYAAIPLGSAIGFALGGVLGQHLGWRPAFFIAGGPGALLAASLFFLKDPARGAHDAAAMSSAAKLSTRQGLAVMFSRPSFIYNNAAQAIYTFTLGGLAAFMPTFFQRERHLPMDKAGVLFGGILCLAGFLGTLVGGRLNERLPSRTAAFELSGYALIASLPFTAFAILSPQPAIFWPSIGITLFLIFLSLGPLNAAIANVLPANVRSQGFAVNVLAIHLLGDASSPSLIGLCSDHMGGLKWPVFGAGSLLVLAGLVLLAGRRALERDLARAAGAAAA
jgi:predicted MFS family arabinose efflux permease